VFEGGRGNPIAFVSNRGDEYLQHNRVVGIGRQRLDGPSANEDGTTRRRRTCPEVIAAGVEVVDVTGDILGQCIGR
jgi:hypothetical protein